MNLNDFKKLQGNVKKPKPTKPRKKKEKKPQLCACCNQELKSAGVTSMLFWDGEICTDCIKKQAMRPGR